MKKIELDNKQKADANSILSKFTTYSGFSSNKEAAYKFTSIIGVKICPYCNIEYTYTVYDDNGLPVFRPDIDHFIPKNLATGDPSLQLNLMNLVPSCMICNERLKRDKPFSRENNIHPYFDDFDNIMDFHINISDTEYLSEENFEINLDAKEFASNDDIKKAYNNISIFKLKERYQFHKNTVVDLFKRITFYNSSKQNEILEIIGKKNTINISFLFPEKNCDINNTSLGKLKKDIINLYLSI